MSILIDIGTCIPFICMYNADVICLSILNTKKKKIVISLLHCNYCILNFADIYLFILLKIVSTYL